MSYNGNGNSAASDHVAADDEACLHALELLGSFVLPMTLKAAIELGLVDTLVAAAGGRAVTAEELAAGLSPASGRKTGPAAAAVDRMLRFLASHNVVRCSTDVGADGKALRRYAAEPVCEWLTAGNGGKGSMAAVGLMTLDKVFMESW